MKELNINTIQTFTTFEALQMIESNAPRCIAFTEDARWSVRRALALKGVGLGVLINDPIPAVRIAVIKGYKYSPFADIEGFRNILKTLIETDNGGYVCCYAKAIYNKIPLCAYDSFLYNHTI